MDGQFLLVSLITFSAAFLAVWAGYPALRRAAARQERRYQRVLVEQLLLEVSPRLAVGLSAGLVVLAGLLGALLLGSPVWGLLFAGVALLVPPVVVRLLEQRRRQRLSEQLVDGIVTLASGVRAGLNLVQAMELLVNNAGGPIRQEFAQLLREYQMGLDLNQAMRNAANRIGLANYRLLFTALEMHRIRGGDAGETLDRIAESIREIQRLEGKLDALTAQGRVQAWMMALMPPVLLAVLYMVDPQRTLLLFTDATGRLLLLVAAVLIAAAFLWIRRIMAVDI